MIGPRIPCALLLLGASGASSAPADPLTGIWCAERAVVTRAIEVRQGAVLRGEGVRDPESVLELWSDAAGGWTLVVSYADGRSCVVALGEAWSDLAAAPS
ncbi:MAG: hypothetical protein ACKVPY_01990 [Paracoccaceae bacterium]